MTAGQGTGRAYAPFALAAAAALLAALLAAAPAARAQGIKSGTMILGGGAEPASPTVQLPTEGQANGSMLDVLDPVPGYVEYGTHEGTGKAIDKSVEYYKGLTELSMKKLKQAAGADGANKAGQALAFKDKMAQRMGFLDKVGTALKVVDFWSTAWKVAGALTEGDKIGALGIIVDDLAKKGTAAAGAFAGTWAGGPVGSVIGATAGEELHKATTGKWIAKKEDDYRTWKAQDEQLAAFGTFKGKFHAKDTSGTITITVKQGAVSCSISGTYADDAITGSCSGGSVDRATGTLTATLSGVVTCDHMKDPMNFSYTGTLSGTMRGMSGEGAFFADHGDDKVNGTWSVEK